MCRSIKQLRRIEETATEEEVQAAARQFVRKISGFRSPSRANEDAFNEAVSRIALASHGLLESLATGRASRPPVDRRYRGRRVRAASPSVNVTS
ncbi:MAG: DUF2277 domain-containing protein [Dehalococcoidia bacterium]